MVLMDDRIQKFARLVEVGSFTKAAQELHISQPALSLAIEKLERELGTQLVVRGNRHLTLTNAGTQTYRAALELQNVHESLSSSLLRIKGEKQHVSIGMIDSIAPTVCSSAIFAQLETLCKITIVVDNSRRLRELVEQGRVDVALAVDDGLSHTGINKTPLGYEPLAFVCHKDLLQSVQKAIVSQKLPKFISYDKSSTTHRIVRDSLHQKGILPKVILYSTSPEVMLQMVINGKGVAALPEQLIAERAQMRDITKLCRGDAELTVHRPICRLTAPNSNLPSDVNKLLLQLSFVASSMSR